jgi:peptide chain release factor 2
MSAPDFWNAPEAASRIVQELKSLNRAAKPHDEVEAALGDLEALCELAAEAGGDEFSGELDDGVEKIAESLAALEFQAMMTEEADPLGAFVTIQAGAGGTESCDWASMLYRMYGRWAEEHGFDLEELDLGPGEVAGIRKVTFAVRGPYAFGRLRSETGVHRLVRISPFDANARRQTSFASVDVTPEIADDINIEVRDADIEMETFMSGGPGGQHQNKTASGVRLRHLPSGLAVECRSERSQHKNRAMAMSLLKARLYQIEQDKRDAALANHYSGKEEIAFGSQIRSYVLHPYQMVKDHRTDAEVGNAGGVLDGNLDPFMDAYLKAQIGKKKK